jgi:hypothetical protein
MVMSLQGTAYYAVLAYSHFTASTTITGNCLDVGGNPDGEGANRQGARSTNRTTVGARRPARQVVRQITRRQPVATPLPPTIRDFAELQNAGYGHAGYGDASIVFQQVKMDVYAGEATIIMGAITSMAGQRKDKWDEGEFEYVPWYNPDVAAVTTGIDATIPWVRDKTYKLTFYRGNHYSS